MRSLLLLALGLSACGREAEPPAPHIAAPAPDPPALPPAPADRIVFSRGGAIWTARSDGRDARKIAALREAGEPAWSPDRRWIAFSASAEPGRELYPRNLFVVRPDGSGLRQVTPMPHAADDVDARPRGVIRGRAVLLQDSDRIAVPGARVSALGLRNPGVSDLDGLFQVEVPSGGAWIRIDATSGGRAYSAWRFAAAGAGKRTELRDVALQPGRPPFPSSAAWCDGGRQLLYVLRYDLVDRAPDAPKSTLRRVRTDGFGDETVATFDRSFIIGGPAVRGDDAWVKLSDGTLVRIDLRDRRIAEKRLGGLCGPDALAVSPDGTALVTLQMDMTLAKSLVLIRGGGATETLASFAPGAASPRSLDFSPDGTRILMDLFDGSAAPRLAQIEIATKRLTPVADDASEGAWHGR